MLDTGHFVDSFTIARRTSRVTSTTIADNATLTTSIAKRNMQNEARWHSANDDSNLIYSNRGWCCAVTILVQSTGCDEEHDEMQKRDSKSDGREDGAPPTS